MNQDLGLAAEFDVNLAFSDISDQSHTKVRVSNLIANLEADGRRVILRRSVRDYGSGRLASRSGG